MLTARVGIRSVADGLNWRIAQWHYPTLLTIFVSLSCHVILTDDNPAARGCPRPRSWRPPLHGVLGAAPVDARPTDMAVFY